MRGMCAKPQRWGRQILLDTVGADGSPICRYVLCASRQVTAADRAAVFGNGWILPIGMALPKPLFLAKWRVSVSAGQVVQPALSCCRLYDPRHDRWASLPGKGLEGTQGDQAHETRSARDELTSLCLSNSSHRGSSHRLIAFRNTGSEIPLC